MAKFYGAVGYVETKETAPGVWKPIPVKRTYYGDVNRITKRWQTAQKLTDDIGLSVEISIVADPYAYDHMHNIRYVEYLGGVWEVTDVTFQHPRIVLSIGGVYNGEQA